MHKKVKLYIFYKSNQKICITLFSSPTFPLTSYISNQRHFCKAFFLHPITMPVFFTSRPIKTKRNAVKGLLTAFSLEYLMWLSFERLTFHRCKGNYGTLNYREVSCVFATVGTIFSFLWQCQDSVHVSLYLLKYDCNNSSLKEVYTCYSD